jgi:RNA 2',3'-cyclic 3'-phosphodiesterase
LSLDHDPAPAGEDGEGRVRLFVAVELPPEAREALASWQTRALRGVDGIRAIAPADLHVTLCFLGWRHEVELEAIRDACQVLAAHEAPDVRFEQGLWLPPRRARVLAVELQDATGALVRAQAALSGVLAGGGWYESETRPYLPHVTVARVARGARVPRRPLPDPPEQSFRAARVSLYRSRLSRSGAHYEALGGVKLGGAP